MKMKRPLCAGIAVSLLLCFSNARSAELFFTSPADNLPDQQRDPRALRNFMESMMDLYAPALKARLLSIEKKVQNVTCFSGSVYLEGEKSLSPTISGEAAVGNGQVEKNPLVNWTLKTSLDLDSGTIGMELWKEAGFGKVSLANQVEQDFSEPLAYKVLLKFKKRF